jgi:hypothetical protein
LIIPALSNDITVTINNFCSAANGEFCSACARPLAQEQCAAFSGGSVMKPVVALLVTLAGLTVMAA